jgi:opacity protein-like surface antigen
MKKIAVLAVLALTVSAAAFGLPDFKLSFGGGGILDMTFGNGLKVGGQKGTQSFVGGGAFAFFDATFVEADFAFVGGGTKSKWPGGGSESGTAAALDLALLGKYPFSLGRVTLFPLLGFDYQIVVAAKSGGVKVDKPGEASSFGFDFGAGLDFPLTDHLFLRGEFLYALRLPSKTLKDSKKYFESQGMDVKYILGNGPTLKLAVGYSL